MAENDFQMVPVTSSQISEVGYDPVTKRLRVHFIYGDSLYQYQNVPQEIYDNLVSAPSVGSYFTAVIKRNPGQFPYEKLG